MSGQWPTPQMAAAWQAMQGGRAAPAPAVQLEALKAQAGIPEGRLQRLREAIGQPEGQTQDAE